PPGRPFRARLRVDHGRMAIVIQYHSPADALEMLLTNLAGERFEVQRRSAAGEIREVLLDLSRLYPLEKFSNAARFRWCINGAVHMFRSNPDEYFRLAAIHSLAARFPDVVVEALVWAVERPVQVQEIAPKPSQLKLVCARAAARYPGLVPVMGGISRPGLYL